MMGDNNEYAIRGAVITAVTLFGGILAGFIFVEIVSSFAPNTDFDELPISIVLAVMAMHISGQVVGGAIWGIAMGRLAGMRDRRRFARAGLLGFVPVTAVMMLGLGVLEQIILGMANVPIHLVFTGLFVPAAAVIASVTSWTFGRELRDSALARRLFWRAGLAAGLAFLLVVLGMDVAGWVVGAPGARARSTMITVTLIGTLAASLGGGFIVGLELKQQ